MYVGRLRIIPALGILAACSAAPDEGPSAPTPSLTLLADRAQTVRVGVDGGRIEVSTPDGIPIALEIPAGALLDPTDITVTPAVITGVGAPIVAAHFAPDGLELLRAARLSLPSTSASNAFAYGFSGRAAPLHRLPLRAVDGGSEVAIHHFSGAGLSGGSISGLATPEDLLQQSLAQLAEAGDIEAILVALQGWWTNIVRPRLIDAETDETKIKSALAAYVKWLGDVEYFGAVDALAASVDEGLQRAATGMRHAFDDANARCIAMEDPKQTDVAFDLFIQADLAGIVDRIDGIDLETFLDDLCVKLEITTIDAPAVFDDEAMAEIEVFATLVLDGVQVDQGPLHVALQCGAQDCTVSPDEGLTENDSLVAAVHLVSNSDQAIVSTIVSWPHNPSIFDAKSIIIDREAVLPDVCENDPAAARLHVDIDVDDVPAGADDHTGSGGPITVMGTGGGNARATAGYGVMTAEAVGNGADEDESAASSEVSWQFGLEPVETTTTASSVVVRAAFTVTGAMSAGTTNGDFASVGVEVLGPRGCEVTGYRADDKDGAVGEVFGDYTIECYMTWGYYAPFRVELRAVGQRDGQAQATLEWNGIISVTDSGGAPLPYVVCSSGPP